MVRHWSDSVVRLNTADYGPEELETIKECFDAGWMTTTGPFVSAFEEQFKQTALLKDGKALAHGFDRKGCVATNSGTAALHLAFRLCGIQPGDHVWGSDISFVASIAPAVQMGAIPTFIDVGSDWCIDVDALQQALQLASAQNKLPKALVVTHVYGHPCDLDSITELCEHYKVTLIEDAAEALGSLYKGLPVGLHGTYAAFSFNGNKTVTTGGGGMLVCPQERVKHAKRLAFQARDPDPYTYTHEELGYNYSLSSVAACIGWAQLKKLSSKVRAKQELAQTYLENLSVDVVDPRHERSSYWLVCVMLPKGTKRSKVMDRLRSEFKVETRPVWRPLHTQPCFLSFKAEVLSEYPNPYSLEVGERGLCLPSSPGLTLYEVERVCAAVNEVVQ